MPTRPWYDLAERLALEWLQENITFNDDSEWKITDPKVQSLAHILRQMDPTDDL